jgi:hypothetical protein
LEVPLAFTIAREVGMVLYWQLGFCHDVCLCFMFLCLRFLERGGGAPYKNLKKHKKHKFWQSFSSLPQVLSPNLHFFMLTSNFGIAALGDCRKWSKFFGVFLANLRN